MSILFPYFELAASLFILLLAFQIWTRHHENRLARFYSRFALVAFFAAILTYSLRIAFTLEFARDINRLSASLWAFVFALYFHFVLIFTKKERILKNPLALFFLYLPPTILSLLFIFTNLMYQRYEIVSVGIISQPAPLYSLFILETAVFCVGGIILLSRYARVTTQKTERIQALLIAIGSIIPVAVGLFCDMLLPLIFGKRVTPPTVVFDISLMNLFIFIAMRNFSLFAINPAVAVGTIIETMPDSLIITDLGGRIIFVNEHAQKFLHTPGEEISRHHIKDLFRQKDDFFHIYTEVAKQDRLVERFKAELVTPHGEHISSLINSRLIREKVFGEKLGIVFVVRDSRG